jgi:hypothetical protein
VSLKLKLRDVAVAVNAPMIGIVIVELLGIRSKKQKAQPSDRLMFQSLMSDEDSVPVLPSVVMVPLMLISRQECVECIDGVRSCLGRYEQEATD